MKVQRNQPCPCGSGEKFKHCHGAIAPDLIEPAPQVERARANDLLRRRQQGDGRPIISASHQGFQFVAVKNQLYYSKSWKTFPDFLGAYIGTVLGADWGNAEIAKPFGERHVIMQWYDDYCRYQKEHVKVPGQVFNSVIVGVVGCYLGLAYGLYQIGHNAELQERLIKRLKDRRNFQGAYYELIVANALIRAGFELELEDETDKSKKHCEFSARSKTTGKRYTVEAKMRSVVGYLGKDEFDGTRSENAISQLVPHLNSALAKPSKHERLIFVDLNASAEVGDVVKPSWGDHAIRRLERYEERELPAGQSAYVFISNIPFHRNLRGNLSTAVAPFGLGIEDFNRPKDARLSQIYMEKVRHVDAYNIAAALAKHPQLPSTLDGRLPSESYGVTNRVCIGDTYFFDNVEGGTIGTVTTASVREETKTAVVAIWTAARGAKILEYPMSDAEFEDYRKCPEAYFGRVQHVGTKSKDRYAQYESLVKLHEVYSREYLLGHLVQMPDFEYLKKLSDVELRAEYCERLMGVLEAKRSAA